MSACPSSMFRRFVGLFAFSIAAAAVVPARAAAPDSPAYEGEARNGDGTESTEASDESKDDISNLPWKAGPAPIDLGHGANVVLPEGYRYLAQPEAGRLMESAGNLHNENLLGIVLPDAPDADYLVTFRYDDEGFIKDDEKLDAKEILDALREGEAEYNEERKARGFPAIHAEGWLEDPRYDNARHHVVWGLLVSSADEPGSPSVNLNTRVLGRRGYVSVNLVTDRDKLAGHRGDLENLLGATSFAHGSRYEDFDSAKDKVAEYGLTGLVLGGAGFGLAKAAKIGLLAKFGKVLLGFLIAAKKGVVVLLAGAAALLRKLFGRKNAAA